MKYLFYFLCLFSSFCGFTQNVNYPSLKVGSKLFIKECKDDKPEFVGIEIYSRTEMYDKTEVDSLTGNGLSKAFFNTKSLEGKRLPCSMGGRAYTIGAIDKFTEKGITHTIVLLYDYYYLNLIVVDFETAIVNKEIIISKKELTKKTVPKKKKI